MPNGSYIGGNIYEDEANARAHRRIAGGIKVRWCFTHNHQALPPAAELEVCVHVYRDSPCDVQDALVLRVDE